MATILVVAVAALLAIKASVIKNELEAATQLIAPLKNNIAGGNQSDAIANAEQLRTHAATAREAAGRSAVDLGLSSSVDRCKLRCCGRGRSLRRRRRRPRCNAPSSRVRFPELGHAHAQRLRYQPRTDPAGLPPKLRPPRTRSEHLPNALRQSMLAVCCLKFRSRSSALVNSSVK